MADRTDYTKLLGERLERAYRAKDDIKPPSAEDIARWKRLAQVKRKEKRKRMKLIASLASVFAVAFCVSIVPMFKIPDAQAGEDYFVDLEDSKGCEETLEVNTYFNYDDLPKDIGEEFFVFDHVPDDYNISEIRIITNDESKKCETQFKDNDGNSFVIKQRNSEGSAEVIVNSDYIENWDGIDVYIREYTNNEENTTYKFTADNIFVDIIADKDVSKEVIKETIKEAIS